jgi:hypothetical protein
MSVQSKREIRKRKGNPAIIYVEDICTQGRCKGQLIIKPIRPFVLEDVLNLKKQNISRQEIHEFGCKKYHFRDNNPWENRYFRYIEENRLYFSHQP